MSKLYKVDGSYGSHYIGRTRLTFVEMVEFVQSLMFDHTIVRIEVTALSDNTNIKMHRLVRNNMSGAWEEEL